MKKEEQKFEITLICHCLCGCGKHEKHMTAFFGPIHWTCDDCKNGKHKELPEQEKTDEEN